MIAGERDGNSLIKVFLRDKGKIPSEKEVREKCSISPNVKINFASVTKEREKNVNIRKRIRKNKNINPLSKEERVIMGNMQEQLQNYEVLLMANHTNLVGIGVSRILDDETRIGQPCIVFHCIDKTIIPFGERTLPKFLEGYPVELKESLFNFAYCQNCPALDNGCSIGRHDDNQSAGSVGFFVKNHSLPTEIGILTVAHVAFSTGNLASLYDKCNVFSDTDDKNQAKHYKIVHPSSMDSETVEVIGHVERACCGNFTKEKGTKMSCVGIDAAYVKSTTGILGGILSIQLQNVLWFY